MGERKETERECPKCGRPIEKSRLWLGAMTCAGCPTHRTVTQGGGRW